MQRRTLLKLGGASAALLVVGSGAGAGITAELPAGAGLQVVIIEEGPLKSSTDFNQLESKAYHSLCQQRATRKAKDKAINILQGRYVGGSTTVNWSSSFRTPASTLKFRQEKFDLNDYSIDTMASAAVISRNVKGYWNLGSFGLGCPTNAKQSMLVTTLPVALAQGAQLPTETRAEKFELSNGMVKALACQVIESNSVPVHTGWENTTIKTVAKHYVLVGGAINSPAVLLCSGAPQSIYSDHFIETQAIDGPIGFKLEAPLLHPVIFASSLAGAEQAGVTRPDGVHWQLENLAIHDGSLFPTSIGVNPQLSVYGVANRLAQGLAKRLTGRDVTLA